MHSLLLYSLGFHILLFSLERYDYGKERVVIDMFSATDKVKKDKNTKILVAAFLKDYKVGFCARFQGQNEQLYIKLTVYVGWVEVETYTSLNTKVLTAK